MTAIRPSASTRFTRLWVATLFAAPATALQSSTPIPDFLYELHADPVVTNGVLGELRSDYSMVASETANGVALTLHDPFGQGLWHRVYHVSDQTVRIEPAEVIPSGYGEEHVIVVGTLTWLDGGADQADSDFWLLEIDLSNGAVIRCETLGTDEPERCVGISTKRPTSEFVGGQLSWRPNHVLHGTRQVRDSALPDGGQFDVLMIAIDWQGQVTDQRTYATPITSTAYSHHHYLTDATQSVDEVVLAGFHTSTGFASSSHKPFTMHVDLNNLATLQAFHHWVALDQGLDLASGVSIAPTAFSLVAWRSQALACESAEGGLVLIGIDQHVASWGSLYSSDVGALVPVGVDSLQLGVLGVLCEERTALDGDRIDSALLLTDLVGASPSLRAFELHDYRRPRTIESIGDGFVFQTNPEDPSTVSGHAIVGVDHAGTLTASCVEEHSVSREDLEVATEAYGVDVDAPEIVIRELSIVRSSKELPIWNCEGETGEWVPAD